MKRLLLVFAAIGLPALLVVALRPLFLSPQAEPDTAAEETEGQSGDKSPSAPPPRAAPPARPATPPPPAFVVAWIRSDSKLTPAVGIVIRKNEGKALVVVQDTSYRGSFGDDSTAAEYAVQADCYAFNRRLPAKWLASLPGAFSLLEVAADDLPDPLDPQSMVAPAVGMRVKILGLAINRDPTTTVSPISETGTIRQIRKDWDGIAKAIHYDLGRQPPDLGLMTDDQGRVVAVLGPNKVVYGGERSQPVPGVYSAPIGDAFLKGLEQPTLQNIAVALQSEERNVSALQYAEQTLNRLRRKDTAEEPTVKTFQFVAYLSDPFHKVKSLQLSLRPLQKQYVAKPTSVSFAFDEKKKIGTETPPIPLTARAPDPKLAESLPGHETHRQKSMFVGEYRSQDEPTHHGYYFATQVSYEDGQGTHYGPMREIAYLPRVAQLYAAMRGEEPPKDAAGLTRSRTASRETPTTSPKSRLKKPLEHKPAAPFPRPTQRNQPVAGAVRQGDGVDVVDLDLVSGPGRPAGKGRAVDGDEQWVSPHWGPPAVFSADGKWLYVPDRGNVLHKIDVGTLQDHAQLEINERCYDLGLSKTALLVARPADGVVWIVDRDSLAVRCEIPVTGVHRVAASPASDVGFAMGSDGLFVIDTARGQVRHFLPTDYCSVFSVAQFWRTQPHGLPWQPSTIVVSDDGRSLYLRAGVEADIHRYRIEGDDLFWEAFSGRTGGTGGPSHNLCVSRDGKWIAHPCGGGNYGLKSGNIAIYDAQTLAGPKFGILVVGYPLLVAFDCQNKKLYSPNTNDLLQFGPSGALERKLHFCTELSWDIQNVVVHPGGGRLLIISKRGICYCDFEPGRLAKQLGNAKP